MNTRIRVEQAGDEAAIHALTTRAFTTAPHSDGTEADIIDHLRAEDALILSLVAEQNGEIVGHAAFSPVTIDGRHARWFGLGPVSVDPAHQRIGIGGDLIQTGIGVLRSASAAGCVVLGDPAYYQRFGFIRDERLTYVGAPPEYFMALRFGADPASGVIAYHPAFGS